MLKWFVHSWVALSLVLAPVRPAYAQAPTEEQKPKSSQLPGTGSLERFQEVQDFLEASKDPDWLLTIGGVALALLAAQRLIRGLFSDVPAQVVPAFVRLRRVKKALTMGDEIQKEMGELIPDMIKNAESARTAAEALTHHLRNVPPKMPYRQRLKKGTVAEIEALLSDEHIRKELDNHPRSRKWIKAYQELRATYNTEMSALVKQYNQGALILRQFSDHTNSLAEGVFMMDALRHKPTEYRARLADEKPPGETHLSLDSGFTKEVTDPSTLPRELHSPRTTCKNLYSRLHLEKTRARMTLLRQGLMRPTAEVALVGTGMAAYFYGSKRIRNRHNADPQQLVEQARAMEQLEAVRTANRMQELNSLAQTLEEARSSKGENHVKLNQVYATLRKVLREHLDDLADDLRFHTSRGARDAAGFDDAITRFREDDAFANRVIDAALADAASTELKTTDVSGLYGLLVPKEGSSPSPMRDRLLMKNFAFSAKYLWPRLTIEGNGQPIQASTVANIVKQAAPLLDDLAKPRTPPAGDKPSGKPSAKLTPNANDNTSALETQEETAVPTS